MFLIQRALTEILYKMVNSRFLSRVKILLTSKKEILTCQLGHHALHRLLSRPKLDFLSVVYQWKLDHSGDIPGRYGCSQSLKHINFQVNFPEVKSIKREKWQQTMCFSRYNAASSDKRSNAEVEFGQYTSRTWFANERFECRVDRMSSSSLYLLDKENITCINLNRSSIYKTR